MMKHSKHYYVLGCFVIATWHTYLEFYDYDSCTIVI